MLFRSVIGRITLEIPNKAEADTKVQDTIIPTQSIDLYEDIDEDIDEDNNSVVYMDDEDSEDAQ